jgi:hypothetical protein
MPRGNHRSESSGPCISIQLTSATLRVSMRDRLRSGSQLAAAVHGDATILRDRILLSTRVVSAAIIPFLVLAFVVLFPWPGDTKRLFAWEIKPTMSPMVLGSVYLGGAYFFFRTVRSSQWHTVAGGFLSVGTFASLMAATTVLHWDRFIHGNVAFWLWVGLYFTTPFVVFAVFIRNQRECVGNNLPITTLTRSQQRRRSVRSRACAHRLACAPRSSMRPAGR